MLNLDNIQTYLNKEYPNNLGFFVFGSFVYETNNQNSDVDLIVILDEKDGEEIKTEDYDIHFISKKTFLSHLEKCEIKALEGFFSKNKRLKFEVDPSQINWFYLRESLSYRASHSWVKGKKKIKEGDIYRGQKSFFHSLRILKMGIQLAKNREITNFSESKELFVEICKEDPLLIEKKYKSLYNKLHSEFKRLAPKTI